MTRSSIRTKGIGILALHASAPTGSINAMRFLTTVSMEQPEMLEKVSREIWMRVWSRVRAKL
jgi:hypothetical protein